VEKYNASIVRDMPLFDSEVWYNRLYSTWVRSEFRLDLARPCECFSCLRQTCHADVCCNCSHLNVVVESSALLRRILRGGGLQRPAVPTGIIFVIFYSIVSRLRAERPEFGSWHWQGIFLFPTASTPILGPTQPPIQWVSGALAPVVKRPRREADHSPPFNVMPRLRMRGAITPLPHTSSWSGAYLSTGHIFMVWCLV
jgi:hypothetical protein